jgi:hypothetical protein
MSQRLTPFLRQREVHDAMSTFLLHADDARIPAPSDD